MRRLGPTRTIIFVEGHRPVLASKIVYHTDPAFAVRLQPPPAVEAITLQRRRPFVFENATTARKKASKPGASKAPADTAMSQDEIDELVAVAKEVGLIERDETRPTPSGATAPTAATAGVPFAALAADVVERAREGRRPKQDGKAATAAAAGKPERAASSSKPAGHVR